MAAAVARLVIVITDAQDKPATRIWQSVSQFFVDRGELLPETIREEYVKMQTALYSDTPDAPPRPLEADEKLERLKKMLWRLQTSRSLGGR